MYRIAFNSDKICLDILANAKYFSVVEVYLFLTHNEEKSFACIQAFKILWQTWWIIKFKTVELLKTFPNYRFYIY